MYEDEYGSKEKEIDTVSQHSPGHLRAKGKSAAPINLAPYCGEREGNGELEVLGRSESSG